MSGAARADAARWTGVLGGSFDPVHWGHLRIARAVRDVFALERVLLVPCNVPPHKPPAALTAPEHRLRMLRLATGERRGVEPCTIELEREGVSYTIDTLRELRRDPAVGVPVFLLGMDSLIEIPTWHDHRSLLDEFDVVAVDRPGSTAEGTLAPWIVERMVTVANAPGAGVAPLRDRPAAGGAVFRLTLEPIPISSRRIRERARNGESLIGLVPSPVARYIQEARLYSREDAR